MTRRTAAKRKTRRQPDPGDTPTDAQLAHGGYVRDYVTHVDSNTKAMAFIAAHDPVDRWKRAGRLSITQLAAIGYCERLWRLAGLEQRVTANYGERIRGHAESRAVNEIEAREDLHRVQGYVPPQWWSVFENVVRWREAAGVAGSSLGFGERGAIDRAHTVVCIVADLIAMKEGL